MNNIVLIVCVLAPMCTALLSVLLPVSRPVKRWLSVLGMAVLVLLAIQLLYQVSVHGVVSNQMGGWVAPMGITLVADMLSALMVLTSALIGLAVAVHAMADIPDASVDRGFHAFVHMLTAGVVGGLLTGDLFNLYVWFEVMLIASFGLMVMQGGKAVLEGAVKYVAINLISTVLLLASIGLLYGVAGTLNLADLAVRLPAIADQQIIPVIAMLFLIAFGIKAAVFPLFFWLPAAYPMLPISVSALFAGLMTKIGVYAVLRLFTLVFDVTQQGMDTLILWVALATMLGGVLGAMAQSDMRRILAFHVIASIGFMLLGLALGSPLAIAASLFYMLQGMLLKTSLFMLSGTVGRLGGSFELAELGGISRARPGLSILFLCTILALIGIPPLTGFWAKLMLIDAGVQGGHWLVVGIILLTSLLSFIPLIRIWSEAFWKSRPEQAGDTTARTEALSAPLAPQERFALAAVLGISLILVVLSVAPGPLISLVDTAAVSLLDPQDYVDQVLGEGTWQALQPTGKTP